ncbi:MAG: lytic transglycosylase domain-containing protein [Lachnospiraceae bacterium]|nr:lytic transglycosylase domain-containing protein [Lachnospiraceae bacterium]
MPKRSLIIVLFLWLAIAVSQTQAMASNQRAFGQRQNAVWKLLAFPCKKYKIPRILALAIARQESDYLPWIINIQGRDYRARTREEGLAIADWAMRHGKSFDVGIMQVNSYWIKKYGWSLETVIDPVNNCIIGCWILAQEIKRHGLNWKAVAYYHTPLHRNYDRGVRYARKIANIIKKIRNNE